MNYQKNNLADSPSLYLRQHAANPVHWQNWSPEVLEHAEKEGKLLLISIGYSSCHWCHVMEEESFEDAQVAELMNSSYTSIKIDREERPDLDARYMNAVQLMTGQGGWPLNCVALPDGTPVWGTTYLSKEDWTAALTQIADLWVNEPEKIKDYAVQLQEGLTELLNLSTSGTAAQFSQDDLADVWMYWKRSWDEKNGGLSHAPKFPMPTNYNYLLSYGSLVGDTATLDYVRTTLTKMAVGGLYDAVGGGFTRYSTDRFWKVPHFEKMLYDNGQLLALYGRAYRQFHDPEFAQVLETTTQWLEREMKLDNGLYATALDADSPVPGEKREEGGYYTWTAEELEALNLPERALFDAFFDIGPYTAWEGKYILHRSQSAADFALEHHLSTAELQRLQTAWLERLSAARAGRATTHPAPRRDDKALTLWNALLVTGWEEAHWAMPEVGYGKKALALAKALEEQLFIDGELVHQWTASGGQGDAFLDDFAGTGLALLSAYRLSDEPAFLERSAQLAQQVLAQFELHEGSPYFYYSRSSAAHWQRHVEVEDNVIPSSNALTAQWFFELYDLLADPQLEQQATAMVNHIHSKVFRYGQSYSQWLLLALRQAYPHRELAVVGTHAKEALEAATTRAFWPNTALCWTAQERSLPLFEGRFVPGRTLYYLCQGRSCQLPTSEVDSLLQQFLF